MDHEAHTQLGMFEQQTRPTPARGPQQSQLTLDSLGRDTSLKNLIAHAVIEASARGAEYRAVDGNYYSHTEYDLPVTDDDITVYCERVMNRRFQRNVIARTRGLMEADGWFIRLPDVIGRTGRKTVAIMPSGALLDVLVYHRQEA